MGANTSNLPHTTSLTRSNTITSADLGNQSSRKNRKLTSTIKKRFSKRNRRLDYSKIIKEFLKTWSTDNLIQLINDYEASCLVREFYLQSEQSRPIISNVSQDLRKLYDNADASDVYIQFKDQNFPVHKSILCARCPLFREILGKIYTFKAVVPIQIDLPEIITTEMFSNLLRFLYSGEIDYDANYNELNFKNLFKSLSKHVPNDLEFDLKRLLDTGIYSDVKIVFKNSSNSSNVSYGMTNFSNNSTYNLNTVNRSPNSCMPNSPIKSFKPVNTNETVTCPACSNQSEYSCHAALLAARSRFFRNLILKYQAKNSLKNENQTINASKQSIRIVLDEGYIQKRYINVVLNSIYYDLNSTDFLNLLPNCVCKCANNLSTNLSSSFSSNSHFNTDHIAPDLSSNNSNATNTSSNTSNNTFSNTISSTIFQTISNTISSTDQTSTINKPENFINELIDLFVIGKFLELDQLISICETLLVEAINLDTVLRILDWSERSNGSAFVRRQALCFLREEFSTIATSELLFKLNKSQFIELIKSDFLQASEYEVMRSILRWVEFDLTGLTTGQFNRRIKESKELKELNLSQNNSCNFNHTDNLIRLSDLTSLNNDPTNLANNQPNIHYFNPQTAKRQSNLEDLRAVINPLFDHLFRYCRIGHILPLENDFLKNILKNDLISNLPTYMMNADQTDLNYERSIMEWINLENRPSFVKPRFFQPFYEEAKAFLDERLARCEEINFNGKISVKKHQLNMPDNLYMVDESFNDEFRNLNCSNCNLPQLNRNLMNFVDLDLNADRTMIRNLKERLLPNGLQIDFDYLDKETKSLIKQKSTENYLKILSSIRTLNLKEKYEILIYIQLKVLRENNLLDEMLFIFEQDEEDQQSSLKDASYKMKRDANPPQPSSETNLTLNLRRKNSKRRKFSLNSTDLENYFDLDDDRLKYNQVFNDVDRSSFNNQFSNIFNTDQFNNSIDEKPFNSQADVPTNTLPNQELHSQATGQLTDLTTRFENPDFVCNLENEISLDVFI